MTEFSRFAGELAREAGRIIQSGFGQESNIRIKADTSPVSSIDLAVNNYVLQGIQQNFPNHTILAEEKSILVPDSDYTWVCDPLDGTVAFIHGIPTVAFSLALFQNGKLLLGLTYDPFLDRLWFADQNTPTVLNNKAVQVSKTAALEAATIGLPSWRKARFASPLLHPELEKASNYIVNTCSVAYMGSLVASGGLDAAIYLDCYAHDIAAVKILVERAGGKVTSLWGTDQPYNQDLNGAIISNGKIHDKLEAIVHKTILRG